MQLQELESSESLTRARQQHDTIVNGMHQKHQQEILLLNEKLDELTKQNQDKVRITGFSYQVSAQNASGLRYAKRSLMS